MKILDWIRIAKIFDPFNTRVHHCGFHEDCECVVAYFVVSNI